MFEEISVDLAVPHTRLALAFATIAYDSGPQIPGKVSTVTGGQYQVVWGPVIDSSIFSGQFSCMYIAKHTHMNEYYVVIRGTNKDSLYSWLYEDFNVEEVKPLSWLPGVPSNPITNSIISEGSYLGMKFLVDMRDPHNGHQTAAEFLARANASTINVTGHSLGGTLSPVMLVYLEQMLAKHGCALPQMGITTFAGLPPGGAAFNTAFHATFKGSYNWRYANSLDIAPLMWIDETAIINLYDNHGLHLGDWNPVEWALDRYFKQSERSIIDYAQPGGEVKLTGKYDHNIIDRNLWAAQAAHQHGTATYSSILP